MEQHKNEGNIDTSRKLKIGVIGSGISGLSAAWLLSQKHEVTIYEAKPAVGIGADSLDLTIDGKKYSADVPPRVICPEYYNHICKLCKYNGVGLEKVHWAVSFLNDSLETYFSYFCWGRFTFPALSTFTLKNIFSKKFWKFMCGYLLFIMGIKADLKNPALNTVSFKDYMKQKNFRYLDSFYKELLAGCNVIFTCNNDEVENLPASIAINTLNWLATATVFRVEGGINNLVPPMVANVNVKTNAKVERIIREDGKIAITVNGEKVYYDHVVVATLPIGALNLLGEDASPVEKRIFQSFGYSHPSSITHSDQSVQKDPPSMSNLCVSDKYNYSMVNMHINDMLNVPYSQNQTSYYHTFNANVPIDEKLILKKVTLCRVLITPETKKNIDLLNEIQGKDNIWYCGSYCLYSANLLEDGLRSAMVVAKNFGITVPWEKN